MLDSLRVVDLLQPCLLKKEDESGVCRSLEGRGWGARRCGVYKRVQVVFKSHISTSFNMVAKFVLVLALVAVCSAQQRGALNPNEPIPIVRLDNEGVNHDGSYKFSYETANNIRAEESGFVKQLGGKTEEDAEANQVQGSYSYVGQDGQTYTITYVADENGFRAEGAHLPTPPPIPEAIARSLEFIASGGQAAKPQNRG
ncbi:hypothetical protein B566_EDAN014189 [Ephemera danica]|nr:hypothetical protein B566_EDAN014189 [Ephemera danica]